MKKILVVIPLLVAACSKPADSTSTPAAATSAATPASSAAPAASSSASAKSAAAAITEYTGSYVSSPGGIFVPEGKEWAGVKWRGDDAGTGIGSGTLALSIQSATGKITGVLSDPLGPSTLVGQLLDGTAAFSIVPQNAGLGFSGTGSAKITSDKLPGTMRLSTGTGAIIRQATFTLAKK